MTDNTKISVTLTPELRLEQALREAGVEDPTTVSELIVVGTLTENDFEYIREKMGKSMLDLDMSDASVENNTIKSFTFGSYPSHCASLTSVTIPASITEIAHNAFCGCCRPAYITVHPDNQFYTSENGSLFNKDKTKIIFFFDEGQEEYVIPETITEITSDIFYKCKKLKLLTVHPDNPVYSSENGVLFNKDKTELIRCPEGRQGEYVIPDSVKKIRTYAFSNCKGLTSFIIPASVTKIEIFAFSMCHSITAMIVMPNNSVYSSENGVLFYKSMTELLAFPPAKQGDYVIPVSITEFNMSFFMSCVGLTSLFIPQTVTKIVGFNHFIYPKNIIVHPDNPVYKSENGKIELK